MADESDTAARVCSEETRSETGRRGVATQPANPPLAGGQSQERASAASAHPVCWFALVWGLSFRPKFVPGAGTTCSDSKGKMFLRS